MMVDLCGGRACALPQIVGKEVESNSEPISLRWDFLEKMYGAAIAEVEVEDALRRLHFSVERLPEGLAVTVPTFRRGDVRNPIDLLEEFVRIHGLENLETPGTTFSAMDRGDDRGHLFRDTAAERLAALGFTECYAYAVVAEEEVRRFHGPTGALPLANPLNADQTHLRPGLLPGLLRCLNENLRNGNGPEKLFEVGRVWHLRDGRLFEAVSVAWLWSVDPLREDWRRLERPDFFSVKAVAEQLLGLARLNLPDDRFVHVAGEPLWQEGHGAGAGDLVGDGFDLRLGLLDVRSTADMDIPGPVLGGELRLLPALFEREELRAHFNPFHNFPRLSRDLALVVGKEMTAADLRNSVEKCIRKVLSGAVTLEDLWIFDVYEGPSVGPDKKSIALRFTLGRADGTVGEVEGSALFAAILEELKGLEGVDLRT
jgi:phenylalanyl-tRNA synthetase beta chain